MPLLRHDHAVPTVRLLLWPRWLLLLLTRFTFLLPTTATRYPRVTLQLRTQADIARWRKDDLPIDIWGTCPQNVLPTISINTGWRIS